MDIDSNLQQKNNDAYTQPTTVLNFNTSSDDNAIILFILHMLVENAINKTNAYSSQPGMYIIVFISNYDRVQSAR